MIKQPIDLMVGREGVEPSTKRLRAFFSCQQNTDKTTDSPLSNELNCTLKSPEIRFALRGIPGSLNRWWTERQASKLARKELAEFWSER